MPSRRPRRVPDEALVSARPEFAPDGQSVAAQTLPAQPVSVAGWRAVQFTLDLAIVMALSLAASTLMALLPTAPDGTYSNPLLALAMVGVVLLVVTALNIWYWVMWPLAHNGRTLVMSWFRLRVITPAGTPPRASQLGLRMLLLVADAMFMGVVGMLAMLSNPARQRIGDALAGTTVVRDPARRSPTSPRTQSSARTGHQKLPVPEHQQPDLTRAPRVAGP